VRVDINGNAAFLQKLLLILHRFSVLPTAGVELRGRERA